MLNELPYLVEDPGANTEPMPGTTEPTFLELNPDVSPRWEGKHRDGSLWTNHVLHQLDSIDQTFFDVIPTDLNIFCPRYAKLNKTEKKYFFMYLISTMVRFESNFDPSASYTEDFTDSDGHAVVSRGLLQISFESSKSYGCGFTTNEEIHDPYKNLSCGIKILTKWVSADGRIAGYMNSKWRGGSRYWSVLRAADKDSYNSIVELSSNLKICR